MATYMRVNPDWDPATESLTGANWRLPESTDVAALAQQIADLLGADGKGSLMVTIEAGTTDAPAGGMVFLNGAQIHSISLVTLPEA